MKSHVFSEGFFRIFIGLEFDPLKDELLYMYYEDSTDYTAIEEYHVKFREIVGDVLIVEVKEEETWTTKFVPIKSVLEFWTSLSWDEIKKKKQEVKEE